MRKTAHSLKVLFLSPEAVPFDKTGGLADVAGSLPNALRRRGVDVRVVSQTRDPGWSIDEALKAVISGGVIGPTEMQ